MGRVAWGWLVIGFTVGMALSGVTVVAADPGQIIAQQLSSGPNNEELDADEPLLLPVSEAQYLNRIYSERSHEIAYCVILDDNRLNLWLADTVQSHSKRVEFSINNCPDESRVGTAHTHPNGNPGMSATDTQTFTASQDRFMCIHAGRIKADPGRKVSNFVCYTPAESSDSTALVNHPVFLIQTGASQGDGN